MEYIIDKMGKNKDIDKYKVENMTINNLSINKFSNCYNKTNDINNDINLKNKNSKTILIIGNGFDLAHGLLTSYSDFLNFCACVEAIFDVETNKNKRIYELEYKLNKELENWDNETKTIKNNIEEIKNNIEEIFNNQTYKNELKQWNSKTNKEYIDETIEKINKYIEEKNQENITKNNNDEYKKLKSKIEEYLKKITEFIENSEQNKENNFNSEQKTIKNTEIIKKKLEAFFKYKEKNETTNEITTNEITTDEIEAINEIHELIKENFWYHYLVKTYRQNRIKNNNWVDFESEIKHVIKKIDEKSKNSLLTKFQKLFPKIQKKDPKLKNIYFDRELENINIENTTVIKDCKTVGDFREKSYKALLEFTRALELYFAVFIENKEIINNQIKLQIDNSKDNCDDKKEKDDFDFPKADYIINFNYTNTYERYSNNQDNNEKICYIHGKCDSKNNIKENNMVLGIDNYWEESKEKSKKDKDNKRDNYTNFTIFRKFAQRIQKNTDNKYYKYLKNIKELEDELKEKKGIEIDNKIFYKIYILGHSLDVTDKDILEKFISSKTTDVTIYSYTKENIGNLIANTIKLIGEETLFKKLKKGTIKFKVQNLKQETKTK